MQNDTHNEQKDQNPGFIRETVIHAYDGKKIIRKLGINLAGGLAFGLAATVTMGIFMPLFKPAEEPVAETEETPQAVTEAPVSDLPKNEAELKLFIEKIMESGQEDAENHFYETIQKVAAEKQRCLVTINGSSKHKDYFEQDYDQADSGPGILIRKKETVYYALAGCGSLPDAEKIEVILSDGQTLPANLEGYDSVYKFAVLSFDTADLENADELETISVNTAADLKVASPVFAMGSPAAAGNSVSVGFVARMDYDISLYDRNLKGIVSNFNVVKSGPASCSFLIGDNGELYGIYTDADQNLANGYSVAYAMDDIMTYVNRIIGGQKTASFGVKVRNIDEKTKEAYKIPDGVYVEKLMKEKPAFNAGVQTGDIICKIGQSVITNTREYEAALMNLSTERPVEVLVMRNSKDGFYEIHVEVEAEISEE